MRFEVVAILILAFAVHVNCEWWTLWGLFGRTNSIDKALGTSANATKQTANANDTSKQNPPKPDNKNLPLKPKETEQPQPQPQPKPHGNPSVKTLTNIVTPPIENSKSSTTQVNKTPGNEADLPLSPSQPEDSKQITPLTSPSSSVNSSDSNDNNSRRPIKPDVNNQHDKPSDSPMPTWKKVTIALVIAAGVVIVLIIIASIVKTMRRDSDN